MSKKHNTFSGTLLAAGLLSLLTTLSTPHSVQAQYVAANARDAGPSISSQAPITPAPGKSAHSPSLRPQGADATIIAGVNTTGTVRVNMLANAEALLNICANGTEIVGIVWGGSLLFAAFIGTPKNKRNRKALVSLLMITGGLATPGILNWLVATARDLNLFS